MREDEVYRRLSIVDIGPLQGVVGSLEFEDSGGVCASVTKQGSIAGPKSLEHLVDAHDRLLVRDHQGTAPGEGRCAGPRRPAFTPVLGYRDGQGGLSDLGR